MSNAMDFGFFFLSLLLCAVKLAVRVFDWTRTTPRLTNANRTPLGILWIEMRIESFKLGILARFYDFYHFMRRKYGSKPKITQKMPFHYRKSLEKLKRAKNGQPSFQPKILTIQKYAGGVESISIIIGQYVKS